MNQIEIVNGFGSLTEDFPKLYFAREAENWSRSIQGKSITDQIKERRIVEIKFYSIMFAAGALAVQKNNFAVYLLNEVKKVEEFLLTLGHEVGHTFHFDFNKNPLYSRIGSGMKKNGGYYTKFFEKYVEPFCDKFAEQWICLNGIEKAREFFLKDNLIMNRDNF